MMIFSKIIVISKFGTVREVYNNAFYFTLLNLSCAFISASLRIFTLLLPSIYPIRIHLLQNVSHAAGNFTKAQTHIEAEFSSRLAFSRFKPATIRFILSLTILIASSFFLETTLMPDNVALMSCVRLSDVTTFIYFINEAFCVSANSMQVLLLPQFIS